MTIPDLASHLSTAGDRLEALRAEERERVEAWDREQRARQEAIWAQEGTNHG